MPESICEHTPLGLSALILLSTIRTWITMTSQAVSENLLCLLWQMGLCGVITVAGNMSERVQLTVLTIL